MNRSYQPGRRAAVTFRDTDPRPRPVVAPDAVIRCRYCRIEWRMPNTPRAEASLRKHFKAKHPDKPQPRTLTRGDIRPTAPITEARMTVKGTTKRARENAPRLTDGRIHPVTVRRIEDGARQAPSRATADEVGGRQPRYRTQPYAGAAAEKQLRTAARRQAAHDRIAEDGHTPAALDPEL